MFVAGILGESGLGLWTVVASRQDSQSVARLNDIEGELERPDQRPAFG